MAQINAIVHGQVVTINENISAGFISESLESLQYNDADINELMKLRTCLNWREPNFWINFQFDLEDIIVLVKWIHIRIYLEINPDLSVFLSIPNSRGIYLKKVYSPRLFTNISLLDRWVTTTDSLEYEN